MKGWGERKKRMSWEDEEEKRKKGGRGVFINRVDGLRIYVYLITGAMCCNVYVTIMSMCIQQ